MSGTAGPSAVMPFDRGHAHGVVRVPLTGASALGIQVLGDLLPRPGVLSSFPVGHVMPKPSALRTLSKDRNPGCCRAKLLNVLGGLVVPILGCGRGPWDCRNDR